MATHNRLLKLAAQRHTWRGAMISIVVVFALLVLARGNAKADALIVTKAMQASTIAEIFVDRGSIRVEMEIGIMDLPAFQNLLPDEVYAKLSGTERPQADRQGEFFQHDWIIRADNGQPLSGRIEQIEVVKRIVRDEITGQPLPIQPKNAPIVIRAVLQYSLDTRPTTLSIKPPTHGEKTVAANIGFVFYHAGLPVTEFRYLGSEITVDLDWNDPWYSRFRNRNLKRQYDAPLSVFLYIEHFEVRKEVIVRPRDLQQWIDLGLDGKQVLRIDEQDALKQHIADFLLERGPVSIDGQAVKPTLDRIHFIRRSLRKTGIVDPPEDLDLTSATLGVIFVYPIDRLPQQVEMEWDLFSDRIDRIPATATDEAGGLPSTISADDPVLKWQNFLTNPCVPAMVAIAPPPLAPQVTIPVLTVVALVVVLWAAALSYRAHSAQQKISVKQVFVAAIALGVGLAAQPYARALISNPFQRPIQLSQAETEDILGGLLHNIYRAFDRREESLVYDRLATSITGEFLTDVYLQIRRSMELENQGGARVKIDNVALNSASIDKVLDNGGFVAHCEWKAAGSVGHWGHTHQRMNQYSALMTVEPVDSVWKATAFDVLQEERVDPPGP